jgi:hypothetical protein
MFSALTFLNGRLQMVEQRASAANIESIAVHEDMQQG